MLNFLQKAPVVNPKHKVVLSTEGKYAMIRLSQEFGNTDDLLRGLMASLKKAYVSGNDTIKELNEFKNVLSRIQRSIQRIDSPNDFVNIIERNTKRHKDIEESLNKIRSFGSMFSFISSVDGYSKSSQLAEFCQKARNAINDESSKIEHALQMKKLQNDFEDNKKTMTKLKSTIQTKDKEMADLIKKQESANQKKEEEIQRLKQQLDARNSDDQIKPRESNDPNFSEILTGLLGFGLKILGNKTFNQRCLTDSDSDSSDEDYHYRRSQQSILSNNAPYPPNRSNGYSPPLSFSQIPGMSPNGDPYPPNRSNSFGYPNSHSPPPSQPGMFHNGAPYPGPGPNIFGGTFRGGPPPPPSMRFPGAPPF